MMPKNKKEQKERCLKTKKELKKMPKNKKEQKERCLKLKKNKKKDA